MWDKLSRLLGGGHAAFGANQDADTLKQRATTLYRQGQYRDALLLLEQALKKNKSIHGSNHPIVATNLNDIGAAHVALGEYRKAITHFEQALVVDERAHAKEHPNVTRDLNNIGAAWDGLQDY